MEIDSIHSRHIVTLIIHEEKIQNSADLHKRFAWCSNLKSFLSLGFSTNTNVYIHSYQNYFTIFTFVLYRTYNLSPSAQVCLSDTTRPLILQMVLMKIVTLTCLLFLFLWKRKIIFRFIFIIIWDSFHHSMIFRFIFIIRQHLKGNCHEQLEKDSLNFSSLIHGGIDARQNRPHMTGLWPRKREL